MRLPGPTAAKDQQIAGLLEPRVACGQRHDVGPADRRHRGEVESGESLAVREAGFGHVPGDAPGGAVGQLVLAERREEAGAAPAFAVGAGAELLPEPTDGWQAQRIQHHRQLGGIDVGHSASLRTGTRSSAS